MKTLIELVIEERFPNGCTNMGYCPVGRNAGADVVGGVMERYWTRVILGRVIGVVSYMQRS